MKKNSMSSWLVLVLCLLLLSACSRDIVRQKLDDGKNKLDASVKVVTDDEEQEEEEESWSDKKRRSEQYQSQQGWADDIR